MAETTFTYDPATDRGFVRLLITDTTVADPNLRIFSDQEIDVFLAREAGTHRAAAAALETIAASEVLIQKKITMLGGDLSTDGPAEAKELREVAASLRLRAAELDAVPDPEESDSGFEIAQFGITPQQQGDIVLGDVLRGA